MKDRNIFYTINVASVIYQDRVTSAPNRSARQCLTGDCMLFLENILTRPSQIHLLTQNILKDEITFVKSQDYS